jgi:hypothetical protein
MQNHRYLQWLARLVPLTLGIITAFSGAQFVVGQMPLLIAGGLFLSAAAPLGFILRAPKTEARQHPVSVSALCGFGCVMVMVGIQRYGDQHQPMLVLALLALVAWMVYQKKIWRR